MGEKSLVVFDFDGTLARGLTICEVLAKSLARLPRMQEIESLKTRAEITAAREEMAHWYDDISESDMVRSLDEVSLAPGLESAFSLLREHGVIIAIASITWGFAIAHFARKWNIEHYIGTNILASGEIEHVWSEQKAQFVHKLSAQLNIPLERVAAVGDSSNDFDMLQTAGVPVYVGAATQQCREGWLHLPDADIADIAKHLIKQWDLKPDSSNKGVLTRASC